MVKLGNVAPEGMCEAGRGCRERTVGSLHVKLNCSLEKSRRGRFIRRGRGRLLDAAAGGVEVTVQGLSWGSLGFCLEACLAQQGPAMGLRGRAGVSSAPGPWLPLRLMGLGMV